MKIRHHSGRIFEVEQVKVIPVAGGFEVSGVVEDHKYCCYMSRKISKTAAAKEIASLRAEYLHQEAAAILDPCNRY